MPLNFVMFNCRNNNWGITGKAFLKCKDYWFVFIIILFSAWVTSYDTLHYKKFYWDNPLLFSIFRDNLQSLNFFHEIAYWFPHVSVGWPAYYNSFLGDVSCTSPIFAALGFLCWLSGMLGITISHYFYLYAFYIFFLVPAAITIGAYALARQLFTSRYVHFSIVILSAFSPGVVLNLSDVSLGEPAAYALFFFVAYLRFLKEPEVRNFYLLIITVMILGLTLNYPFILWNVFGIPMFIFFVSIWPLRNLHRTRAAFNNISLTHYSIAGVLIFISLIPLVATYLQGADLVRSTIGKNAYSLEKLLPGNPLELLSISIPGFGFEWRAFNNAAGTEFWTLLPFGNYHLSINYLGLFCLPLSILGLIYGPKSLRIPLLWMIVITFTIMVLSAVSPILALILSVKSPLLANNHFSDLFFRCGGYLFLIYSSALGLSILLKDNTKIKIIFLCLLGGMLSINVVLHTFYYGTFHWTFSPFFAISIVFSILYSIIVCSMMRYPKNSALICMLLFIVLADISTCTNLLVKNFKLVNGGNSFQSLREEWNANNIGAKNSIGVSGKIFVQKNLVEINKLGIFPETDFQKFILFSAVHSSDDINKEVLRITKGVTKIKTSFKGYDSLPIAPEDAETSAFKNFIANAEIHTEPAIGTVDIINQSYNTLELHINSSREAALLIRDAYSPYWKAWLNGEKTPIARGFYNFKTVIVPKGESKLILKFDPPFIGLALLISYISILVLLVYFITECPRLR